MAKDAFNYNKSYNDQLRQEINGYKLKRTIFLVLGIGLFITGLVLLIINMAGVVKDTTEAMNTSHSVWEEPRIKFDSWSLSFIYIFMFGIMMSGGLALIGVGAAAFTTKIKNRERVLREGTEVNSDCYTIDELDKKF